MACDGNTFITGPEARIIARDSVTIFKEICAIQQAILEAISGCPPPGKYSVVIPQPVYADPPPPITATGAGMLSSTVRYTVASATVLSAGDGYPVSTTVNAIFSDPTATEATLGAALTDGDAIIAIPIVDGGTGYIGGETVVIGDQGSGGTGATAVVSMVTPLTGEIIQITVTNGGTGYTITGEAALLPRPNTTALGTVVTDATGNVIAGSTVTITNPGAGYLNAPTLTVENPLGPFEPPVIYLPITPMTTTLDIDPVDGRPDSWMYYETHVGQLDSPEIEDQLAFVQKFFTDLGYIIELQVNPLTMNTLQWYLKW